MANFTIGELCASQVAQKKEIDNTPSAMVRVHLTETMTLLENIRAEWEKYCEQYNLGTPSLIVSSGYRSPELNKAVGGVKWKSHTNLTHPGKYFRPSKVKIMRPTSPK